MLGQQVATALFGGHFRNHIVLVSHLFVLSSGTVEGTLRLRERVDERHLGTSSLLHAPVKVPKDNTKIDTLE